MVKAYALYWETPDGEEHKKVYNDIDRAVMAEKWLHEQGINTTEIAVILKEE